MIDEALEHLVKGIVDNPDDVNVKATTTRTHAAPEAARIARLQDIFRSDTDRRGQTDLDSCLFSVEKFVHFLSLWRTPNGVML